MYLACQEGHLSVCKWLYQAGAAADITKATRWDAGWTPMLVACQKGSVQVASRDGRGRGRHQGDRKKAPLPCSSPRTGAPARRGVVKERVSAARALRALASTSLASPSLVSLASPSLASPSLRAEERNARGPEIVATS